jgi:hypothetical protein
VIGDVSGDRRSVEITSRVDGRSYPAHSMGGAFSLAQLPVGDYTASLGTERALPAVPFHVAANRTTAVSLTGPGSRSSGSHPAR